MLAELRRLVDEAKADRGAKTEVVAVFLQRPRPRSQTWGGVRQLIERRVETTPPPTKLLSLLLLLLAVGRRGARAVKRGREAQAI